MPRRCERYGRPRQLWPKKRSEKQLPCEGRAIINRLWEVPEESRRGSFLGKTTVGDAARNRLPRRLRQRIRSSRQSIGGNNKRLRRDHMRERDHLDYGQRRRERTEGEQHQHTRVHSGGIRWSTRHGDCGLRPGWRRRTRMWRRAVCRL